MSESNELHDVFARNEDGVQVPFTIKWRLACERLAEEASLPLCGGAQRSSLLVLVL